MSVGLSVPLRTRSGKTLARAETKFVIAIYEEPEAGLRVSLNVPFGGRQYPTTLDIPQEAVPHEFVLYDHEGITVEPETREEVDVVHDDTGRVVGVRKEVYPSV